MLQRVKLFRKDNETGELGGDLEMVVHSVHRLLRSSLILAQVCALFPVTGVMAENVSAIRFRWCSVWIPYWSIVWVGHLFLLCRTWTITHFREPNGSLSAISNSTLMRLAVPPLFIYTLFLRFSYKWPQFVRQWESIERRLILRSSNQHLLRKMTILTFVFATLRFIFFSAGYVVTGVRVTQCLNWSSLRDFFDILFYIRFPPVFTITPLAPWKFCLLAFLELVSSWSWLCSNLVILNLASLLSYKFQTFNRHLDNVRGQSISIRFWKEMRREYTMLTFLFHKTDSLLSPLIFALVTLETMNVILFIYLALTYGYSMISYIYFAVFFLSFLGVDSVTLVAMAAVFDESKKALSVLQQLPTVNLSFEAERLYLQARRSTIALTGCKFFIISHTAILSIISALVTYEVLLVQLGNLKHEPELIKDDDDLRSNSTQEYCNWIQNYLQTKE